MNLAEKMSIFILLLLTSAPISPAVPGRLFIWNVGQGQWITWKLEDRCLHFDMGGELAPFHHLRQHCGSRSNILYLSHADLDHIRFIPWGKRNLPELCMVTFPREPLSGKKLWFISHLKKCANLTEKRVVEVEFASKIDARQPPLSANGLSRVFLLHGHWGSALLPGDSTYDAEKRWAPLIRPYSVHHLVLGHHGSLTSTSPLLLEKLSNLKVTYGSSRRKRYGHPHSAVVRRLQKKSLPLLLTEKWGHISFDL